MSMVVKAWALDQWFQLQPRMLTYVSSQAPHQSPQIWNSGMGPSNLL